MDYFTAALRTPGFVPSALLVLACYALLRALRPRAWPFAMLAFPGTLAHELAHFAVGLALGAQPEGLSLWPRRQGGRWILGAVSFHNLGILNAAFVALAPLLLLPLAAWGLVSFAPNYWTAAAWGRWLATGYLVASVLLAALPSREDLKQGALSIALYGIVAGLIWWGLVLWRARG